MGTAGGGLLLAGYRRAELEQYKDGGKVIARQDGFDLGVGQGAGAEGFHEGGIESRGRRGHGLDSYPNPASRGKTSSEPWHVTARAVQERTTKFSSPARLGGLRSPRTNVAGRVCCSAW